MLNIKTTKTTNPKPLPEADNPLTFGTIFTDHMFMMNYETGKGWFDPRIVPYQPLNLDPSTMVFHYAQEVFEGLKAYKTKEGGTLLFRPERNAKRANDSNRRVCIPEVPEKDFIQAIRELVKLDEKWIPEKEDTSLYIRPFFIATDPFLGVRPSHTYLFIIILSPVGAYYPEGLNPIKIWVEEKYVRTVKGAIGDSKAGGNYEASLLAQVKAKEEGYSQVLWLDGIDRKYVEEVGAMNIFFKIKGKIITPELSGSILPGVTRDSVITLCKDWGLPVEERKISILEIAEAQEKGTLEEVFGTGTAAVISPVGSLKWEKMIIEVQDGKIGDLSKRLYDTLTGIQLGRVKDEHGWTVKV